MILRSASQINLVAASSLGEVLSSFEYLAQACIDAFNRIGRVDHPAHFGRECIHVPFDSLLLQAAEERLGTCIIPTVSPAAHAGHELVVLAPAIKVITAKLAALV